MSGTGYKTKLNFKIVRDEITKLQGEKSNLNKEMDKIEAYLQEQNKLLHAKDQQLAKAACQVNDLIPLIDDKVVLIRRLQSQIDWLHNQFGYKIYSRAKELFKIFLR